MGDSDDNIFPVVVDLICELKGINKETVTMESRFVEDINSDSLDTVELIMAIEDKFNIKIPDEMAEKILTVGNLVEYIKNS